MNETKIAVTVVTQRGEFAATVTLPANALAQGDTVRVAVVPKPNPYWRDGYDPAWAWENKPHPLDR